MICAPAKSLEPTMIAGLSPVEPLSLFEPPDDPQAASTRTKPTSIAPSARPLNRILPFRMIRSFPEKGRRRDGRMTLGRSYGFPLDRRAGRDARVDRRRPRAIVVTRACGDPQPPGDDEVLHDSERELDGDRQQGDEERAGEQPLEVLHARSVDDEPAQATPTDDRRE